MSEKIYDLEPLTALVDGNEKFKKYLIELFIQTTPPILEDLKKALENGDVTEVYAHTHKVKPTLDSMGMKSLRPIVDEIMAISKKKGSIDKLRSPVEILCNQVSTAIGQLQSNEL